VSSRTNRRSIDVFVYCDLCDTLQVGWTPLIIASSAGRDDIVAYLLECSSVHVNAINSTGQCALHYAASKDRFKVTGMYLVHSST